MKCFPAFLSVALLVSGVSAAAQTPQTKPVSKKTKTTSKPAPTPAPAKPAEPPKPLYPELTITELISEDANRWSDKMDTRASVSGFITQVEKAPDGDTAIRICENPKIDGMDRARCVIAKCVPKIPCDVPHIGKPVTVKGITQYDAKVGAHWWEIHPVEEIEK
ncbi:MAG TPA: hypothetical protein VMH31_16070 [Methylomirabilota bacterium]|nr:hypothetical protein [Methylomirabilota bacterium]